MEKVTYSTKRKKRRTRRCLDEIRNRLQRKCSNSLEHSIQNNKSSLIESKKLENRLVTMDRLTLKAMFPNAITSETITRSVLEEMKQKQNVHNFVNVTKFLSNNLKSSGSFINNVSITECGENSLCKENNYKKHDQTKSSNSLVLLSPTGSINKALTLCKSVNEDAVNSSTSSSQPSQDYRHRRYEELMNEIPSSIRHMASSINNNIINKTISILHKLYMESCQKEYEENIIKCNTEHALTTKTFHTENQLIVENPLDYIRLEHERQQNRGALLESLSDSLSIDSGTGDGTPRSPTSPAPPASPPDLHIGIIPYDTPDYNYYPHRLK